MHDLVEKLLGVAPIWVFLVVALLVFVEDAVFVGFVVPGETAAVIGGVYASRGSINVVAIAAVVVVAAIVGDSVGYEIGRKVGPRLLRIKLLDRKRDELDRAQRFLAERGGSAVFFGRFIAFFRAVMPALAGISRMPYRRFLVWNAIGGTVWGVGFVLLGYLAGNSWDTVASQVGTWAAVAVAVLVVLALVVWHVRSRRAANRASA